MTHEPGHAVVRSHATPYLAPAGKFAAYRTADAGPDRPDNHRADPIVPARTPSDMSDRSLIDHVGIAVNSLAEAIPRWSALLGREPSGREEVPSEGVRVAFFGRGRGRVELLEPIDADTPVGRFLERRGPGVHHVCLAVDDLEAAARRAEERGLELLEPGVRAGAGGRRVAFFHPRSTGGVLVELSEVPSGEEGADEG